MPYITVNREPRSYQLTLEDILNGVDDKKLAPQKDTKDTTTWKVERISRALIEKTNWWAMKESLRRFVTKYNDLISMEDKTGLYWHFKIPKRSGGLRQIDAPNDELKAAQYELKTILEKQFYMSYHTTAFAYVRGRCTIDAVKRHQVNNSRWFLKTDMRHFFPSTSPDFLMKMLCMTFPFCHFVQIDSENKELLEKALSLCFLNGGLPQGTPTSPMLTNAMMIPIDHAISKMCHEYKPHLRYTRYADDLLISSQYDFKWSDVQGRIIQILKDFGAPFVLHPDKTRYGSSSGRNWNLGVMLNADNNITIGFARKKMFRSMVFSFMADDANGITWDVGDIQHLLGLCSYYKMVEKEPISEILNTYSQKFHKNVEATAKAYLRS